MVMHAGQFFGSLMAVKHFSAPGGLNVTIVAVHEIDKRVIPRAVDNNLTRRRRHEALSGISETPAVLCI